MITKQQIEDEVSDIIDKADAKRYRWLKSQKRLSLESDYMNWTREDGSKFISTYRLCGNYTGYSSYETLDETIDEAMKVDNDR